MSKERAKRRAERLAVLEREKVARARKVARRQRRRELIRRVKQVKPRVGRTGRLYKRNRRQRVGIVVVPLLAIAVVWLWVPEPGLRIVLTVVIGLALPALVVLVLGRKD